MAELTLTLTSNGDSWHNRRRGIWMCADGVRELFAVPRRVRKVYVTAHRHPTRDRMEIVQAPAPSWTDDPSPRFHGDGDIRGWGRAGNEWLAEQELHLGQPFYIQIEYDGPCA